MVRKVNYKKAVVAYFEAVFRIELGKQLKSGSEQSLILQIFEGASEECKLQALPLPSNG
jgi:hypothetical protein